MALKSKLTTVCVQKEIKSNRKDELIENDDSIGNYFSDEKNNSIKKKTRDSIKKVPTEMGLKLAKHRNRSTSIGRKKRFSGNGSDRDYVNNCAFNYPSTSVSTLALNNGDFDISNISNEANESNSGYDSGNSSKTSLSEASLNMHIRSDTSIRFDNKLSRETGQMKGKSMKIVPPLSSQPEMKCQEENLLSETIMCTKYVDTNSVSNHDSGHSSSESIDFDLHSMSDPIEIELNNNSDDKLITCLAEVDLTDSSIEVENQREKDENVKLLFQIEGESIRNEYECSVNLSETNENGSEALIETDNSTIIPTDELTDLNKATSPPNLTYFVYRIPYDSTEVAIQVRIPSTNDVSAATEVIETPVLSSMLSCQTFELCEVEITNEDGLETDSLVENERNWISYHESNVDGAKVISKSVVQSRNTTKSSVENLKEKTTKTPLNSISKNVSTRNTAQVAKNISGLVNSKSPVQMTRRGRPRGSKNLKFTDENIYSSDIFFCDTCPGKIFKSRLGLKKHISRHLTNELRQKCVLCGHRPRNLENHMRMKHSTVRHKCDFCEKSFKSKENQLIHMRTHTGERPYVCSVPSCGMSFRAQATWRKHENRVHRFVKNHRCDDCGRLFHSPYLLEDHVFAFHTDERPYSCNLCGKNFATRHYLRTHKIIHGEKVHKCRHCDKMFALTDNRRKHERRFHKIK